ncbi:hypothetical protein BKN14_05010 [Candidatus Gracilibacteria bacterium HOT-871]|nr:hypothetical protein BKN14_05010 [Candidatus Gracilibacteria bacterium HOT-871]
MINAESHKKIDYHIHFVEDNFVNLQEEGSKNVELKKLTTEYVYKINMIIKGNWAFDERFKEELSNLQKRIQEKLKKN